MLERSGSDREAAVHYLRSIRKGVWFGADPIIVYATRMGGDAIFAVAQEAPPRHLPWTTIRVGASDREVEAVADKLLANL